MDIVLATEKDFDAVKRITQTTIKAIYPKYYSTGAVDFFIKHHSDENISRDIADRKVYLLCVDGKDIGTVTVNGNEVDRLFVLPDFQSSGYGKALIGFAEQMIKQKCKEIILAASLPAKQIYRRYGYVETEYNIVETENGDFLCFDMMKKEI